MTDLRVEDVQRLHLVREAFGEELELEDPDGHTRIYRLLDEFTAGGSSYAIVQDEPMRKADEIEVFRLVQNEDGSLSLETVEDDEEWETIAELYDEMSVSFED
ncbi:DUF1292 domain-containing protein [Gorillibacterium sp. CAU 1737]|uniref:DUF1292 domain-containing protein n=1 Tax=Gorillibacterium sp. CAU 1737 TaxID=3140362 RepID=UPI0032613E86